MEFPDDPHTLDMCSEKLSDNSLAPDETKMKFAIFDIFHDRAVIAPCE